MTNIVKLPTAYFPDPLRGFALSLGKVFIGVVDLDPTVLANRIVVTVLEEDGTLVPIATDAQPFILNDGGLFVFNGSVVQLQVDSDFSMTVQDSEDVQKYFFPDSNSDIVIPATTTNRFPLNYTDGASGLGLSGTAIETFFDITPSLAIGDQVITNSYDSSGTAASDGIFQYTGNTDAGRAGNVPDPDGFFYDADGFQFEIVDDVNLITKYGAVPDGATDNIAAFDAAFVAKGVAIIPETSGVFHYATKIVVPQKGYLGGFGASSEIKYTGGGIGILVERPASNPAAVIIEKFKYTSATAVTGIKIDRTSRVVIKELIVRGDGGTGFIGSFILMVNDNTNNTSQIEIIGNLVQVCKGDAVKSTATSGVGLAGIRIMGNRFQANLGSGINITGPTSTSEVTIIGNIIEGNEGHEIFIDRPNGAVIMGNHIEHVDVTFSPVSLAATGGSGPISGTTFKSNTIEAGGAPFCIDFGTATITSSDISNNLCTGAATASISNFGAAMQRSSLMNNATSEGGLVPQLGLQNAITAFAGGGQANAKLLTDGICEIRTVATAGDSVKLPVARIGMAVLVYNRTTNSCDIYPNSTGDIDGGSNDVPVKIAPDTAIFFSVISSGIGANWFSFTLIRTLDSSVAWDPGSIADGDEEVKQVTVSRAELGDFALASLGVDVQDLVLTASVTATDTVTASLSNNTGAPIDLGSSTLKVKVIK